MKSERSEKRDLCADLVKIRWQDADGRQRREFVSLEDISAGGACLHLEDPIPLETPVVILYPNGKYRGRVKYCILKETGYLLGVQFDSGYRWSTRLHKPAHLSRIR